MNLFSLNWFSSPIFPLENNFIILKIILQKHFKTKNKFIPKYSPKKKQKLEYFLHSMAKLTSICKELILPSVSFHERRGK